MDSLGDYIYLVVIVLAGISGLLGKKKRRTKEVETIDLPDLDDIIPEFTEFIQPESVVNHHEFGRNETMSNVLTYDTIEDFSVMKAKRQVKSVSPILVSQPESPEDFISSEIELNSAQEIRKAFIYSEILNRKYS